MRFWYLLHMRNHFINPFWPNELSYSLHSDQSISVLRAVWCYKNVSLAISRDPSQTLRSVTTAMGQNFVYMSHKKDAMIYGLTGRSRYRKQTLLHARTRSALSMPSFSLSSYTCYVSVTE